MRNYLSVLVLISVSVMHASAQNRELRFNFNDEGTRYVKATFTGQVWVRHTENNPGTRLNGFDQPSVYDIGLRRVRSQLFGMVTDKVFLYTQFGINNFGYNSARKPGLFFHDVIAEYHITPRALQVGGGLSAWTGPARYSSPGVASFLAYDAPLYQQTTNDANDQFLRKFSVYAKGKIGRIDYRLVLTDPMAVDNTTGTVKPISTSSDFAWTPPKWQTSGYVTYQFLNEESNLTPYTIGSYLGKKKVLNLGIGYQHQPHAMWRHGDAITKDTVMSDMLHYNADVFFDHPMGKGGAAITCYAAFTHLDYGRNYLRSQGVMNPSTAASGTSLSGGGNAIPLYGTGNVYFAQAGYLLPRTILGDKGGQIQPFAQMMLAQYERLASDMLVWDAGFNWLIDGHRAKVTLNYNNRPVFDALSRTESGRRSMVIMQIQIAI